VADGFDRFEEPNVTVTPDTKFVPIMVKERLEDPAGALEGESDVIVGTGFVALLTRIDSALLAVCLGLEESWACIVKLEVPAVVGVPVMAPVPLFSDRPAGRAPLLTDHA